MSTYILDAADSTTEATWLAYKRAQTDVRDQVGVAYRAVSMALAMYGDLGGRLTKGDLAGVAEYHVAKSTGLLTQEQALIGHLQAAIGLIEDMQAKLPTESLFPNVPKVKLNVEETALSGAAPAFAVIG